jgi:hypothetical protein
MLEINYGLHLPLRQPSISEDSMILEIPIPGENTVTFSKSDNTADKAQ